MPNCNTLGQRCNHRRRLLKKHCLPSFKDIVTESSKWVRIYLFLLLSSIILINACFRALSGWGATSQRPARGDGKRKILNRGAERRQNCSQLYFPRKRLQSEKASINNKITIYTLYHCYEIFCNVRGECFVC